MKWFTSFTKSLEFESKKTNRQFCSLNKGGHKPLGGVKPGSAIGKQKKQIGNLKIDILNLIDMRIFGKKR